MIDWIALDSYQKAHIIWWRKAINKYFLKEFGFEIKFYPEIENE